MTREERENALHCLKVMIDEEVCEECNLYGTTGTDHCEADCVRVAIEALKEQMSDSEKPNKWIPLTKRPMTEEEREEYEERTGITERMIFDCPLPDDGEEVLVCYGSYVFMDIFHNDDNCYFEEVDINEAEAWMPLPTSYKAESEEV